jgi:putative acetyltransferase
VGLDVVIRRAEISDAEGFASIYLGRNAAAGTLQTPYPSVAQWKERLAQDPSRNYVFAALVDGRIVGSAGLHSAGAHRRAHAWHLGVSVHDDYQGQGIGAQLMSTLIDLADNWLGALRLELTVYSDNARAIALYEKFGFVREGLHRAYSLREGVYVDTVAMARFHPRQPLVPKP